MEKIDVMKNINEEGMAKATDMENMKKEFQSIKQRVDEIGKKRKELNEEIFFTNEKYMKTFLTNEQYMKEEIKEKQKELSDKMKKLDDEMFHLKQERDRLVEETFKKYKEVIEKQVTEKLNIINIERSNRAKRFIEFMQTVGDLDVDNYTIVEKSDSMYTARYHKDIYFPAGVIIGVNRHGRYPGYIYALYKVKPKNI